MVEASNFFRFSFFSKLVATYTDGTKGNGKAHFSYSSANDILFLPFAEDSKREI
jgi:hypothetical protein